MKFKYILFSLIFSYLLLIVIILFFVKFDVDVNFSNDSLINMLILIVLLMMAVIIFIVIYNRKINFLTKRQLEILEEDDYLIEEFQYNAILKKLIQKNILIKECILSQNEKQNKWVHDIKIPLTTLNLFIENNRNKMTNDQIEVLESIALNIDNDINKKIMYDKIELDIDDYKIDSFNIKDIIIKVIKKFRVSFILKKNSVSISFDELIICSDIQTITYVLEQIISNAIKYSYENTIIKIFINNKMLVIENESETISSQDINRVFDNGYTGINSINNKVSSTGIGLYMVKKALNNLNHDVFIESNDNKTRTIIDFKIK